MDITNLNSFLKFGYFLNYQNSKFNFDYSVINKDEYINAPETELIDLGGRLWLNVINKNFELGAKHLVPISGGLDSRAILGALLEFTEAKNIHTYTFGTPGTLDYDIGNYIAKKAGTNHSAYPLTEYKYSLSEEIMVSNNIDHQSILFHHPPFTSVMNKYSDFKIWSGFTGGELAGSHVLKNPSENKEEAIINFINKNTFVKSCNLLNNNGSITGLQTYLSSEMILKSNSITLDDLFDFNYRQLRYIAPLVLMDGFNYKTPFLDEEWFSFMMGIPNNYRENQYLYNEILINSFPKLFKYKTKHNSGLSLGANKIRIKVQKGLHFIKRKSSVFNDPYINYIDFNYGIRNRKDLNTIIYSSIMDLKERKIIDWINVDNIWKRHINKESDHADALITLASLEIHLKAGKSL